MHIKVILYLLFCVHCVARTHYGDSVPTSDSDTDDQTSGGPHNGLPDNGSGIPPNQTSGGPHVGLPEAHDNHADDDNRPVPDHSFVRRVLLPKSSDKKKKVFVSFTVGCFTFKKKREKASRVTFTCNGCEKSKHYLPVMAWRERVDSDEENDVYTLDIDTLPSTNEHVCAAHGMEVLVKSFRQKLMEEVRLGPTRPFPTLYLEVRFVLTFFWDTLNNEIIYRSSFTRSLSLDEKLVFLADIPSYDTVQSTMYSIRRQYIPPAPLTQAELDTSLDWFKLSLDSEESIIKGDIIHSDGLRVLLFSSDESLKIMSRARTILADGTFRITPYLWYQTFILSAEFRENRFVPVCFGLLPDKTKRSYNDFFNLVKDALGHPSRNLELAAEWMMSDFEMNIRTTWQTTFPQIKPKGCHFHYSKVLLTFVKNVLSKKIVRKAWLRSHKHTSISNAKCVGKMYSY